MCLARNFLYFLAITLNKATVTALGVNRIDVDEGLQEYADYDLAINMADDRNAVQRATIIQRNSEGPVDISKVSDMIEQMPEGGSFHIHTFITLDEKQKMRNRNHFYVCDKFDQLRSNEICNATQMLLSKLDEEINSEHKSDEALKIPLGNTRRSNSDVEFRAQEEQIMLGYDVVLTKEEKKLNDIFMQLKNKLTNDRLEKFGSIFPRHFFKFRDEVKKSHLFKLIKAMPKGAVLYAHDIGVLGPDYLVDITYQPNLYVCFNNNRPVFFFSANMPLAECPTKWQTVEDARFFAESKKVFDMDLKKHFSLITDHPQKVYSNRNTYLKKIRGYFDTVTPLLSYKPVWEKYIYDVFKAFREDGVMYVEIRSNLPELYDLEGNVFDSLHTAAMFKKVLEDFKFDFPDFFGAKLIYTPLKMATRDDVLDNLQKARKLKVILPDIFAGIDILGDKDKRSPLKKLIPEFAANGDVEYFYHADECHGQSWNEDSLYEAIMLQVKRIGNAFGIMKHPVLLKEVKANNLALEVNVVSSMAMRVIDDVKNHPLAQMIARRLPVVLTSGIPGVWGSDPITHDFYITFLGISSRRADLRLLKKLALSSIAYSEANNKDEMLQEFLVRWFKFIDTHIER